jgi:predicted metal-dependent phosphotriesterase family hydrolase
MASINTVLGPLEAAKLGFTLMHEHVAIASAGVRQTYPELYGDLECADGRQPRRFFGA